MIYPKCLYKTRELATVAKDEKHHVELAKQGWLDNWKDEKPNQFVELAKKEYQKKLELVKELDEIKKELEEEAKEIEKAKKKATKKKEKKDVKDANRKDNTKGSFKAS